MPERCILLENKPAHKQIGNKWNPLSRPSYVNDSVPKGTLLVELTDAESRETSQHFTPPLNYKKYSDNSVKLYCKPEHVWQLNEEDFNLLLGVKKPSDCYKALNDLNWVRKLIIGFGVNVTIPTIPHPVSGVIWYIGPLPDEEGTKFGLELLVR